MLKRWIAALMAVCMLLGATAALAQETEGDWIPFLLMCNEGMQNDGGNAGNTMMVVSVSPTSGRIRLMIVTWDTFVDYPGYDVPQLLDQPYRNNGPEETASVFNVNFGTEIDRFLSLNYLNLANLIDSFGGVTVEVTRAERNALNSMVASKKENIQAMADQGLLTQLAIELLADTYYLNDYGPETHLNGLQAVGFGWLQYDSVYNCCLREVAVIGNLFSSVGKRISEELMFCTDASGEPEAPGSRYVINLDHMSDADKARVRRLVAPIFDLAYSNLTEEEIEDISLALAYAGYLASRQGFNIFDQLEYAIFPLEATNAYDYVARVPGHIVDLEANGQAMTEFLFGERD